MTHSEVRATVWGMQIDDELRNQAMAIGMNMHATARLLDVPHMTFRRFMEGKNCTRKTVTRIKAGLAERKSPCQWSTDGEGVWSSACGQDWQFIDGGPAENNCRFCHGCGKPIEIAADETASLTLEDAGQ